MSQRQVNVTNAPRAARVTLDYWTAVTPAERRAVAQAADRYARFLGTQVTVG